MINQLRTHCTTLVKLIIAITFLKKKEPRNILNNSTISIYQNNTINNSYHIFIKKTNGKLDSTSDLGISRIYFIEKQ